MAAVDAEIFIGEGRALFRVVDLVGLERLVAQLSGRHPKMGAM